MRQKLANLDMLNGILTKSNFSIRQVVNSFSEKSFRAKIFGTQLQERNWVYLEFLLFTTIAKYTF